MICSHCNKEVYGGYCGCCGKQSGVELIRRERIRQVEQEGWTIEHDHQHEHSSGELAWAAACYAAPEEIYVGYSNGMSFKRVWPWSETWDKRKKHDRLRQLVIAGAPVAAEIDRLQGKH